VPGSAHAHLHRAGVTSSPDDNTGADRAAAAKKELLLQGWLAEPAIKSLLTRIKKLPTIPKLHAKIVEELQSPNGSLEIASQYIRQDPVMSAKFLQIVNSAYFGLGYAVADPGEAVIFLGVERTRALALMTGVFSQFEGLSCAGFSAEEIWRHCLQVGGVARGISLLETENPKLAETAFTTGLLHDIGKLVLAANVPERYAEVLRRQSLKRLRLRPAEQEVLGTTHSQLGACLLGTWSLPVPMLEAIAWHHCPSLSKDTGFTVLTAVHAANILVQRSASRAEKNRPAEGFDSLYLMRVKVAGRQDYWREACGLEREV
jgi:HD-like signal output (HDOD) protein